MYGGAAKEGGDGGGAHHGEEGSATLDAHPSTANGGAPASGSVGEEGGSDPAEDHDTWGEG